MIAFEVWHNGEKLCLASVGETGVLTQMLTWSLGEGKAPSDEHPRYRKTNLHVGGLANGEHLRWLDSMFDVEVGDEVTIHIVEVESADEPPNRHRRETGEERAQKVQEGLDAARALLPSPIVEGDFLASPRGYDELLAAGEPEVSVKVLAKLGDLNECPPAFWEALHAVARVLKMYNESHVYGEKADVDAG